MASNLSTKTIKINGMTCVNCENKIEQELLSTKGVSDVEVSYSAGAAKVIFDADIIKIEAIEKAIEKLDYKVIGSEHETRETDYTDIFAIGLIIIALYMVINHFGGFAIFNYFPQANVNTGYGMLFIIGLLTSVHCISMCGGINLSQCMSYSTRVGGGKFSSLRPSLLYNLGRVTSYTIIGAIVGGIGSVISFSVSVSGIVQLVAGLFMIIMGINMLNLFPWLRRLNPRMPKFFARKIISQKQSNSSLYVGLLNGLMPCGPLQAMQLYALSTGDPLKGAVSMFLFSAGTVPLMFGIGALSSFISQRFSAKIMTAGAVLVVVLGMFMLSSGASLSGINLPFTNAMQSGKPSVAVVQDGIQVVTSQLSSGRYEPIVVQKGVPVRWIIEAEASDINGCNNRIIIPKFDKEKKLVPGDNIIEFTPTEIGTIPFSCWMGMIRSRITVVDDIDAIDSN